MAAALVERKRPSREEDFILKASLGDEAAVGAMLGYGTHSSARRNPAKDDFRVRGLVKAVKNGHLGVVEKIVAACPYIAVSEQLDEELGLTLLHVAAWTGQLDRILKLRDLLVGNVRTVIAGVITPLHLAASGGHLEAVSLFLQWPIVEVLKVRCSDGLTALHWAANGGHAVAVGLLLQASRESERCIDPKLFLNAVDRMGRTPLHHAARGGHVAVVELLLQAPEGVDVLIRDGVRESTPFLLACMMPGDNVGVVQRLLERDPTQVLHTVGDVKVSQRALEDLAIAPWKRLWEALVHKVDLASVRAPYSPDDFEVEDEDDKTDRWRIRGVSIGKHTALHLAAAQDNARVVEYLLQQPGIDANARDGDYGLTPLHCAVRTGAVAAVQILVECKEVDVNAQVRFPGWIPRNVRLKKAKAEEVDFLEGKCARFWNGDTALHLAIRFGPSQSALQSVSELCRLKHLQPSLRNGTSGGRVTAVEVALQRWNSVPIFHKFLQDEDMSRALIDTVAEHRDLEPFLSRVVRSKKAIQDTLNVLLVAATLIAGASFQGSLQPPAGSATSVERFWVFNAVSFYLSMFSIITTLEALFSTRSLSLADLEAVTSKLQMQLGIATLSTGLSVLVGALAFSRASLANSGDSTHHLLRALGLYFLPAMSAWFHIMCFQAWYVLFNAPGSMRLPRMKLLWRKGVHLSRADWWNLTQFVKGILAVVFVVLILGFVTWKAYEGDHPPAPSTA